MPGATPKYALPYSAGGDTISTIDNTMQSLAQAVEALVDQILPAGTLAPTARGTAPTGWALCEGQVVAQAGTYAALFAAIGAAYNTGGEGAGNFRLPNMKGKVPVGRDAAQTEFDTLGEAVGAKTVALTNTAQLPAHTHTDGTLASAAHAHGTNLAVQPSGDHTHVPGTPGYMFVVANGNISTHEVSSVTSPGGLRVPFLSTGSAFSNNNSTAGANSGEHAHALSGGVLADGPHDVSGATGSVGSGAAHDNIQPSLVVNYMVKL